MFFNATNQMSAPNRRPGLPARLDWGVIHDFKTCNLLPGTSSNNIKGFVFGNAYAPHAVKQPNVCGPAQNNSLDVVHFTESELPLEVSHSMRRHALKRIASASSFAFQNFAKISPTFPLCTPRFFVHHVCNLVVGGQGFSLPRRCAIPRWNPSGFHLHSSGIASGLLNSQYLFAGVSEIMWS